MGVKNSFISSSYHLIINLIFSHLMHFAWQTADIKILTFMMLSGTFRTRRNGNSHSLKFQQVFLFLPAHCHILIKIHGNNFSHSVAEGASNDVDMR